MDDGSAAAPIPDEAVNRALDAYGQARGWRSKMRSALAAAAPLLSAAAYERGRADAARDIARQILEDGHDSADVAYIAAVARGSATDTEREEP